MSKVTGGESLGCPWRAAADPFVAAVIVAHRHWLKGELGSRLGEVPEALMRGVESFDVALNAAQAFDINERAKPPPEDRRPTTTGPRIQWMPAHRRRPER